MIRSFARAALAGSLSLVLVVADATGPSDATAVAIMKAVAMRADSGRQQARLRFTLTPKSGAPQVRDATAYRAVEPDVRRTSIVFVAPPAIRGSSFLAWDVQDPAMADDQWLYLPALRRARRIPAHDRGAYFLGTDLTYEDMRSMGRLASDDYRLEAPRPAAHDPALVEIEGTPLTDGLRKDLGYGRVRWTVDPKRSFVVRSTHWDVQGAPLKTVTFESIEQVDSIWMAKTITVDNQKTGHRTRLEFSDVTNRPSFDPALLTPAGLERGG
ncbi:MAG TPA: outer membrane lipoprotein-sorting protein [Nevskiaceae bacterium]|nr:outer membrane lipoprotein-sorting protein [Nevskiaceae bacterium]